MPFPTDPTTGREYDEDDWDNDAREFRPHTEETVICEFCNDTGVIWSPYELADIPCDACRVRERDALAAERDALRRAVTLALFYLGGEEADEVRAELGPYDPT